MNVQSWCGLQMKALLSAALLTRPKAIYVAQHGAEQRAKGEVVHSVLTLMKTHIREMLAA